jgi:hypothetical protein
MCVCVCVCVCVFVCVRLHAHMRVHVNAAVTVQHRSARTQQHVLEIELVVCGVVRVWVATTHAVKPPVPVVVRVKDNDVSNNTHI